VLAVWDIAQVSQPHLSAAIWHLTRG
jgi:hypothetical protein